MNAEESCKSVMEKNVSDEGKKFFDKRILKMMPPKQAEMAIWG